MYEIENRSIDAENVFAGEFPVAKDFGTVETGKTIHKLSPIVIGDNGIVEATADTLADVVGIAAEEADGGEDAVYYLTGEFFAESIYLPTDVTVGVLKPILRKLNIFLK